MLIYLTAISIPLAIILDAIIGDPKWLYNRINHPVVLFGTIISFFDHRLNIKTYCDKKRLLLGALFTITSIIMIFLTSLIVVIYMNAFDYFWILESIIIAIFLSHQSLFLHIYDVYTNLKIGDITGAKTALSNIVSRDVADMDESDITRSTIESLAENFSDGIIAPLFWAMLLGLPGIITYKYINTLDSMIGYKSDRYLYFGKFAARIDDIANFIPARLSVVITWLGALLIPNLKIAPSMKTVIKDANKHKSINAGYPESAYAGLLAIKLAGPRSYHGKPTDEPFIGNGRKQLIHNDIKSALILFTSSCLINLAISSFILSPAIMLFD